MKLLTKINPNTFVQTVTISNRDPERSELFEFEGRTLQFVSPPFNPAISLDDLIGPFDDVSALMIAFDLGSYQAFLKVFEDWLKVNQLSILIMVV